jgi:hypothetical protein
MALMSYRPIFQAWGIAEADPMQRIRDKLDAKDAGDASGRDG